MLKEWDAGGVGGNREIIFTAGNHLSAGDKVYETF